LVDLSLQNYVTPLLTINVLLGQLETNVIPAAPPFLTVNYQTYIHSTTATTPSSLYAFPAFQVTTLGYSVVLYKTSTSNSQIIAHPKLSDPSNLEITIDTSVLTGSSPIQFYIYGRTDPGQDANGDVYFGFTQLVTISVTCGFETVALS
jgi:hypothetical protein